MTISVAKKVSLLVLCSIIVLVKTYGQQLEKVSPVLSASKVGDSTVSFMLNSMDFLGFKHLGHARYSNSVQIIDADQPWPPRWYSSLPIFDNDSINRDDDLHGLRRTNVMNDLRFQNGYFTFYKERSVTVNDKKQAEVAGYLICNRRLEVVDTFKGSAGLPVDLHDFRINEKGERLVLLQLDTVLDLRKSSGRPGDSRVAATINIIQVLDSANHVLFSWNPVTALGANAFDYKSKTTLTYAHSLKNNIDWSHGTSLNWDFDGNILYGFRFIGIGKISVKNGSLMWHLDWNKTPLINKTDTLAFYPQHDFDRLNDNPTATGYTLFSNGNPSCAYQFSVSKTDNSIHAQRKFVTEKKISSPGWGSFEQDEKGDYLLNYGQFPKDTAQPKHVFLEYKTKTGAFIGKYELPAAVYAYKVHFIKSERPPRPEVIRNGDNLFTRGDVTGYTWYKLSGPNNTKIEKVGEGPLYTPVADGVYCVAMAYGIGYTVSKQYVFKK